MPNATVRASAAALTKSRRPALGLFGALPAFAVLPSAAKAASVDDHRRALRQPILDAYCARAEAEPRMPELQQIERIAYFSKEQDRAAPIKKSEATRSDWLDAPHGSLRGAPAIVRSP